MSNITINDLFGNPVDNSTPFILLTTKKINSIIKKLDQRSYDSIWEFDKDKLSSLLKPFDINIDNYRLFGHMFFNDYSPKSRSVIIIHKDFSILTSPTDYQFIGRYGSGYVWLPIGPSGFVSLGLVYTSTEQKPSKEDYRMLDVNYALSINKSLQNKNILNFMANNEFNLLNSTVTPIFTIYRSKLYKDIRNFKLIAFYDEKYITSIDSDSTNNNNLLKMRSRDNNNYQYINYSASGELKIGDKCISSAGNNHPVNLQECNDSDLSQKWYMYNNNIVSHQDNTCLTLDETGENIKVSDCENSNSNQVWVKEKPEVIEPTEGRWYPSKGKNVILVDSDNPWYLNNEFKEEAKIIGNKEPLNQLTYQPYGDFKSKFIMDLTRPDLGYGHSYAERLGKPCPCNKPSKLNDRLLEGFGKINSGDTVNMIILILCILIIVMLAIKYKKN